MLAWRVFERTRDGALEYWKIRQEGIRCFIGWGPVGYTGGRGSVSTLDDEEHARRHLERKIQAQLRLGYIEVAGEPVPTGDPDALVVDTIADALHKPAHGLERPECHPIDSFSGVVCHAQIFPRSPNRGFYHYLILRDEGRSAVAFNVQEASHNREAVAAFLETAVTIRDLPFNGRSHQKLPLTRPAGQFDHILLCSPALGGAAAAYPDIARRVATAFPIYDCEIGDADPEVLVDARIHGHGSLPYADWNRPPHPVVDLRFDVKSARRERNSTFKVFELKHLHHILGSLAEATPDSWLEVRSFRQDIRRVTPADITATTTDVLEQFLRTG
jgi:predicted DNA-binding WGR domain protein